MPARGGHGRIGAQQYAHRRFHLSQILPGTTSMAFVGTRPMIPDKLSEPLLVIIDNHTGAVATLSRWQ